MLHEKAVKKVEKALGVEVQHGGNGRYWAEYNGHIVSWRTQQWDGKETGHGWHVRSVGDVSDPMTDYYAGSFRSNCTQMINAVRPPEPKFPVGCLVRGKNNKRATRQGYAGKVGLVTKTGTYLRVNWLGEEEPDYAVTYPERDLELIS